MENEKRLIDANALTDDTYILNSWDAPIVRAWLDDQPTVDAVEVVHARWNPIRNFGGGECYGYCTNCKTPVKADNATGLVMSNRFCHWCGAKMDG